MQFTKVDKMSVYVITKINTSEILFDDNDCPIFFETIEMATKFLVVSMKEKLLEQNGENAKDIIQYIKDNFSILEFVLDVNM